MISFIATHTSIIMKNMPLLVEATYGGARNPTKGTAHEFIVHVLEKYALARRYDCCGLLWCMKSNEGACTMNSFMQCSVRSTMAFQFDMSSIGS